MGVRTKPHKLISLGIMMAATVVALFGCSDELEPNLAECKTKAMDVSRAAPLSEEKPAAYLRECMRAKGWPLRDACLDRPQMWDSPDCYLR
jgi:hypothetical protein